MIQCPNCHATLPDWQKQCQFCQSDTSSVIRSDSNPNKRNVNAFEAPKWVWFAYYGLSAYWIVEGFVTIINTHLAIQAAQFKADHSTTELEGLVTRPSAFSYAPMVFAAISILIGIGMIFKNNTIRGIVNFFSAIKILVGLCGIVGTLIAGMIIGPWALLYLVIHLLNICSAVLMIYLIGETDKYAY